MQVMDVDTKEDYACKVIAKASLTKPRHKQKVNAFAAQNFTFSSGFLHDTNKMFWSLQGYLTAAVKADRASSNLAPVGWEQMSS